MPQLAPAGAPESRRAQTYHIIFDHDRGWAKAFDAFLILAILASVAVVMLDSVSSFETRFGAQLRGIEWFFTILFSVEYALRVWCVRKPRSYALSFFGLIDLLAVLPTYASLILPGGQFLAVIRVLRVIRVFRVFKLVRFVGEASVLTAALRAARYKIAVFLVAVASIVVVVGSTMYLLEGPESGFTSIPRGVYWAVVTLTTVGYGDIAPMTPYGQAMASLVMILGYGIIAVPTGIVTAELTAMPRRASSTTSECESCRHVEVDVDASYCRMCGAPLPGALSSP
jgi:voltage-gated potassium channel